MDPNGYELNSAYTMGNGMEKYGNNGSKVYSVTESKCKKNDQTFVSGMAKKCFGGGLHNVFIGWSKGF